MAEAGGRLLRPADAPPHGGFRGYVADPDDHAFIAACLERLLLFGGEHGSAAATAAARDTYVRPVVAGEIVVREGDDASPEASELFVVKAGEFEVLERRAGGANVRVNMKMRGDCFGEVGRWRRWGEGEAVFVGGWCRGGRGGACPAVGRVARGATARPGGAGTR